MVEIRESLARSRTALFEAGGRAPEDQVTQLQHAKSHLHQAHGALQMVDVDGVSLMTEVAEAATRTEFLEPLQQRLLAWHDRFFSTSRHDFFDTVVEESGVLETLVGHAFAARQLTDLLHLAEILRDQRFAGLSQLADFVDEVSRVASDEDSADVESGSGQWSRRVEAESDVVRIMTIHASKGLEFPIVLVPYLEEISSPNYAVMTYRAMVDGAPQTIVDISATGKCVGAYAKKALTIAEHRRKAYVAFTRAKYRNVLWTFDAGKTKSVLQPFADRKALADDFPPLFRWGMPPAPPTRLHEFGGEGHPVELAKWSRRLDPTGRQLSFSAITRGVASTGRRDPAVDDEPDGEGVTPTTPVTDPDQLLDLRTSARLGNLIHAILQTLDTAQPDRRSAFDQTVQVLAPLYGYDLTAESGPNALDGLSLFTLVSSALDTDLGEVAGHRQLADIPAAHRLAEMSFSLRLGTNGGADTTAMLDVIRRWLSDDPWFRTWCATVSVEQATTLLGSLNGSLDAVLSWEEAGEPRFLVVDYKSNRLNDHSGRPAYDATTMEESMRSHNYFLQALIYLVALHRLLRSRLGASYRYDRHVAGAAYLYLQGMNPAQPGSGVVPLSVPEGLIAELSDLFEGATRG
jgi:exodeoxyribonuclease V beta subunit